jgi:hypothetical protein
MGWKNVTWYILQSKKFTSMFFFVDWKSKMATIPGHYFSIGLHVYGENIFFSEIRNLIEPKLNMNNH